MHRWSLFFLSLLDNSHIIEQGSGKTFSMGTNSTAITDMVDETSGIIPRMIHDLFEMINNDKEKEYTLKVSFMEVHNEQV